MPDSEDRQFIVDQEHVRLLSIFYLVSACLSAAFSVFGLLYVLMGVFISGAIRHAPPDPKPGPPPEVVAWIISFVGIGIFVFMLGMGALKFLVYRRLRQRRSRVFCMVVAGLICIGIPYGTLLGVFTFWVLTRPSVVREFEASLSADGSGA